MRICVLDTETSGLDPATAGVVEYAHAIVDTGTRRVSGHMSRLCHPGEGRLPIPPDARAVHHISDDMVAGMTSVAQLLAERNWASVDALCAHNAPFDRSFLVAAEGGQPIVASVKPWLDTLRLAKHLWPSAPSYGNQVLRYWRGVEPAWPAGDPADYGRAAPMVPHRALYDVCTTAALLLDLLRTAEEGRLSDPVEVLLELSGRPVLLQTCSFGKHRGLAWSAVPRDYLTWMNQQRPNPDGSPAWDEDTTYTLRYHLGFRS